MPTVFGFKATENKALEKGMSRGMKDCNDSSICMAEQQQSYPEIVDRFNEVSRQTEVSEVCCLSWAHISDSSTLLVEPCKPIARRFDKLCVYSTSCINFESYIAHFFLD